MGRRLQRRRHSHTQGHTISCSGKDRRVGWCVSGARLKGGPCRWKWDTTIFRRGRRNGTIRKVCGTWCKKIKRSYVMRHGTESNIAQLASFGAGWQDGRDHVCNILSKRRSVMATIRWCLMRSRWVMAVLTCERVMVRDTWDGVLGDACYYLFCVDDGCSVTTIDTSTYILRSFCDGRQLLSVS